MDIFLGIFIFEHYISSVTMILRNENGIIIYIDNIIEFKLNIHNI